MLMCIRRRSQGERGKVDVVEGVRGIGEAK